MYIVLFKIILQLAQGDVVAHKTRFDKFCFLGNAGGQHRKRPVHLQIPLEINSLAGDGTVNRGEIFQKLRLVYLDIIHDSGTGLSYDVPHLFLFDSPQMRPCADVCAHGNVVDKHAFFAEIVQNALP